MPTITGCGSSSCIGGLDKQISRTSVHKPQIRCPGLSENLFGIGDRDDFLRPVADVHARGMKLVLDGVFNHMGRNAPIFQDAVGDPSAADTSASAARSASLTCTAPRPRKPPPSLPASLANTAAWTTHCL